MEANVMDFMLRSPVPDLLQDTVQRTFTRTLPRQRGHERAGLGVLIHDAETRPPVGLTFPGLPAHVSETRGPKKVPAHLCVPGCLLDIIATSSWVRIRILEGPSPHRDEAEPSRKRSRFCRVPRGDGKSGASSGSVSPLGGLSLPPWASPTKTPVCVPTGSREKNWPDGGGSSCVCKRRS